MNVKNKLFIGLVVAFYFVMCSHATSMFSTFSNMFTPKSDGPLQKELEKAKRDRHIEIRRELEREATPFLEDTKSSISIQLLSKIAQFQMSMNSAFQDDIQSETTSWYDYLSAFSVMDLIMMMFSFISLGLGTIYIIWRNNPFASKVEK